MAATERNSVNRDAATRSELFAAASKSEPALTGPETASLRQYLAFYALHRATIDAEVDAAAARSPRLELAAQCGAHRHPLPLVRAAAAPGGSWGRYAADLHARAVRLTEAGVPFEDWLRLTDIVREAVLQHACGLAARARLFRVMAGLARLLEMDTQIVLSAYRDANALSAPRPAQGDTLFASSPDATLVTALDGTISAWNPSAERLYGYAPEEAIGRPSGFLVPADGLAEAQTVLAAIRRGETIAGLETVRLTRDGRLIDVSLSAGPLRNEEGFITGACQIARDITGHKEHDRQFELAVEAAPSGIVMVDGGGRIMLVNAETERLFGYTRAELLGQPVEMLVPAALRPGHAARREESAVAPSVRFMGTMTDLVGLRKDETDFPVEIGLNPISTPDGLVVLAAIVDITARKQAVDMFRLAVEASPSGMVMGDEAGTILLVNAETDRLFGYAREELINLQMDMLLPERFRASLARHRAALLAAPAERSMGIELDVFGLRKDGSEFPIEVRLTTAGPRVLAAIVDITARREAELDALRHAGDERQAQRMESLGQLAGGIAHDFNNVLAAITGYGELLMVALDDQPNLQDDVGEILSAAHRAAEMTRQLLAFSRRQPLAPEPLDLNVIVDDLERLLSRLVGDDVRITTEFYAQPLMIMADRGQLAQVLINLIVNARDAMPRGGTVTISTELEEAANRADAHGPARAPRAVLRVADEGTGMDQQTRDHIFEPFFTTKAAGQGTGLGLSTVYGIVIVADGEIAVESTLGHGTTFAVTLPLVGAEGPALQELPASAGGSETLLLVEDEDAVRAVARRALERAGYTVIEIELPNEALTLTPAVLQSIDLVLSDISMPGLSGPLLAQRLRVRRPDLPVLFMSGYSSEHLEEQYGLRQGEVLRKPFESAELYRAVRGMLDRTAPAGRSQSG